ncbi:electron transporter RnfA [candidate division TA06 bacterium DG_24]|jgi:electron transport complex protein RnfA|uniref:Ion-translocating oxidoreductase complex subunit A n=3 Tax=Bacteria division TA06 TaxID=1156500 RepID=A0A0S8JS11_UNCT6|nr:MAG: electron transporter RnfA [candidate division TA06 bacterium DG_24]KPK71511.1 MAG: electron transporter RnfA [candidate division TA06 bacterium SM23_40]KPL11628.1 MAG: electron transporter RnfA [candidate division TA06 bacterium SM1_40]
MGELFVIFVAAVLVNNFVLARFLGICPFLGVSKKVETAFGMGMAVIFVMTLASVGTILLYNYVLVPLNLGFLQIVAFILVIASLVQFVETVLRKTVPALYKALGIYLPLITTNCAILGLALLNVMKSYNFLKSVIFGLGAGIGFTLALLIMSGIRERLEFADVPKSLRGVPIALITASLLSIAFLGFTGLIKM